MRPIRLGVIGTGLIWMRTHKPILETLKEAITPIAFCDVSEQRRAATAQAFPGAPVLNDHHDLLAIPEVEAVLVLTPIALNAPVAMDALRAGKHVIMEKPIARSVDEGRALIATARQAGKRLFVAEQMAYRQAEAVLADLIGSGVIGDLVMWECIEHLEGDTAQGPLRYDSAAWRKHPDFPLGPLFDGGVHLIARLSKVFGAPETISATGRKLRPEYGEYDHVAAIFEYANGSSGLLSHSNYLPPLNNHLHVYGTTGAIRVERDRIVVEKPEEAGQTVQLPEEEVYNAMWQALLHAFDTGDDPFYTAEKALRDVAILEAIGQAIKSGQRAPVGR